MNSKVYHAEPLYKSRRVDSLTGLRTILKRVQFGLLILLS